MAKRVLYFLRDSLTGLYYTDASNTLYTWDDTGENPICDPKNSYHTFENAVIHTTENSVKDGQKKRVKMFKRHLGISDEDIRSSSWLKMPRELAKQREKLPHFGIEIVKIQISD